MKSQTFRMGAPGFWIALVFSSLCIYVLAQQGGSTNSPGRLTDAIALLKDGKPQAARDIIESIPADSPDYGRAQCYKALCQYESNDELGFLNQMETAAVKDAVVSVNLKEELASKQIGALFKYRRYEELVAKTERFKNDYAASDRLAGVAEVRMASLYERGMKKVFEATRIGETNRSHLRWTEGKANLEEFVALSSAAGGTNYRTIDNRDLKRDRWVARVVLGDQNLAAEELRLDAAEREKFRLLKVQLTQKLEADAMDRNLQLMSDFVRDFPESKSRKRVEFDLASLSFSRGEILLKEAEAAERAGDAKTSDEKRGAARQYFEYMRLVQRQVTADPESGIEASDVFDLLGDLLYSYFLEQNYSELSHLTTSIIATSEPGDLDWIIAKVYDGIALRHQNPPRITESAAIFDQVLAFGFKNRPGHDYYVLLAVKWQIDTARVSGDESKARRLEQWVQASNCTKDLKTKFLKEHAAAAAEQPVELK